MWSIPTTHPTTVPHSNRIKIVAKPLRSHSHRQNNPSPKKISSKIFWQPLLRCVDTPPESLERELPRQCKNLQHQVPHAPPLRVRAHDSFSSSRTSPLESPTADLLVYVPGFLIQHLHLHFFLCFVSDSCTFLGFLDFSDTQRHLQDFGSCFAPSSPLFHPSDLL